jgi:hypothetical protein
MDVVCSSGEDDAFISESKRLVEVVGTRMKVSELPQCIRSEGVEAKPTSAVEGLLENLAGDLAVTYTKAQAILACGSPGAVTVTAPPGAMGTVVRIRVETVESQFTRPGHEVSLATFTYS